MTPVLLIVVEKTLALSGPSACCLFHFTLWLRLLYQDFCCCLFSAFCFVLSCSGLCLSLLLLLLLLLLLPSLLTLLSNMGIAPTYLLQPIFSSVLLLLLLLLFCSLPSATRCGLSAYLAFATLLLLLWTFIARYRPGLYICRQLRFIARYRPGLYICRQLRTFI